ncbi:MAG: hypothetical protein ACK5NN_01830 [Sphingomonadaceae bacterium]
MDKIRPMQRKRLQSQLICGSTPKAQQARYITLIPASCSARIKGLILIKME